MVDDKPRAKGTAFSVTAQPGFTTMAVACFFMLYAPMLTLVVYSFNAGESIAIWDGFSFKWYEYAFNNREVRQATVRSLQVATFATLVSTTVATMAGACDD